MVPGGSRHEGVVEFFKSVFSAEFLSLTQRVSTTTVCGQADESRPWRKIVPYGTGRPTTTNMTTHQHVVHHPTLAIVAAVAHASHPTREPRERVYLALYAPPNNSSSSSSCDDGDDNDDAPPAEVAHSPDRTTTPPIQAEASRAERPSQQREFLPENECLP